MAPKLSTSINEKNVTTTVVLSRRVLMNALFQSKQIGDAEVLEKLTDMLSELIEEDVKLSKYKRSIRVNKKDNIKMLKYLSSLALI